jgi:imidazoleglycerol-phosphate dehydratase
MSRTADVERVTAETRITVHLDLDGQGRSEISTGIGFLDHMLAQVSRHGFMDIVMECQGDLQVDSHHTAEDAGIALGKALAIALEDKKGIRRYGAALLPMEDALILCALDFSGRPYLAFDAAFTTPRLGELDTEMIEEFFRALCLHSGCNLHIRLLAGKNNHHIAEAMFKAFGKAVDQASSLDARIEGTLSTKDMLE